MLNCTERVILQFLDIERIQFDSLPPLRLLPMTVSTTTTHLQWTARITQRDSSCSQRRGVFTLTIYCGYMSDGSGGDDDHHHMLAEDSLCAGGVLNRAERDKHSLPTYPRLHIHGVLIAGD